MPVPSRLSARSNRGSVGLVVALLAMALVAPVTSASADIERTAGDGLVPAMRWAGVNRYDTAALIATDGTAEAPVFAGDTVIVARGDAFPDGLAGSFLTGLDDAPIVLTASDRVPAETAEALDELDPARVVILGGEGAVSLDVEEEIGEGRDVLRLGGRDRYATAAGVAVHGANAGAIGQLDGLVTAILVTGERGPDALVAGPVAAAEGFPVFLTPRDALPAGASGVMEDIGVEQVIIVGGEAAVSPAVATALENLEITVRRVSGDTRETTAVEMATFARDELGWPLTELHFASGADRAFADSLALGPRSARSESPILLLGPAGPSGPVRAFLGGPIAVDAVAVAGGNAAVSPQALANARTGLAVQAAGLAFPRGLTTGPDDAIYVAESGFGGDDCVGGGEEETCFGFSGAVTRIEDGVQNRAYSDLPSGGPGAGVVDVAFDGTTPVAAVGLGVPAEQRDAAAAEVPLAAQLGTLSTIGESGSEILADLALWEAENNADDREPSETGDHPLNSNPFAVARDTTAGVWAVADAGGNSLLEVTDDGAIELIATFPDVETADGPLQYVPTSVVVGPEGDYFVGGLGGEAPGEAVIYRVDAQTEAPEPEVYAEGFTFVMDLGFDDAGNLYVLQAVPTNPVGDDGGPGVVIGVPAGGGERTELGGGGLVFPLGLEVAGDGLYVSHCPFCPTGGEVLQLTYPE